MQVSPLPPPLPNLLFHNSSQRGDGTLSSLNTVVVPGQMQGGRESPVPGPPLRLRGRKQCSVRPQLLRPPAQRDESPLTVTAALDRGALKTGSGVRKTRPHLSAAQAPTRWVGCGWETEHLDPPKPSIPPKGWNPAVLRAQAVSFSASVSFHRKLGAEDLDSGSRGLRAHPKGTTQT